MEKQGIIFNNADTTRRSSEISNATARAWKRLRQKALVTSQKIHIPLAMLSKHYSHALEQPVSIRQAIALTEAQLAFIGFILPDNIALTWRTLMLIWFLYAVRRFRKQQTTGK